MPDPNSLEAMRDELIRMLRGRPAAPPGGDMPLPPRPYPFSKEPVVATADPNTGQLVQWFAKQFPGAFDNVRRVQRTPTLGVLESLRDSEMRPEQFGSANLMGQFDRRQKDLYISPNNPAASSTMAHELAHSKGYHDETDARQAGDLVNTLLGVNYLPPTPGAYYPPTKEMEMAGTLMGRARRQREELARPGSSGAQLSHDERQALAREWLRRNPQRAPR